MRRRRGGAGETEVLPLYGRLSSADQHRVFEPSKVAGLKRRVVLATNVAETSLTVPGIRYVVDAGTARISRYSARSKVQRLPIEAISQASASQRSGRSGRTSDGIAIRLYSEEDFERRPEFTDPEVLRTNLAAVILQMASLDLGAIEEFPFLTPPDTRGIRDGLELLRELGAIDEGLETPASRAPRPAEETPASRASRPAEGRGPQLTRIGRQLARLPIEPRFARMVLESKSQGVSRDVLAIVAGLTIQDPRERPLEKKEQADGFHARFVDPSSDFLTLLNLWNHLEEQQRQLSGSAFRRMCRAEFLNYLRVREWQDLYRQLVRLAKPLGLHVSERAGEPNADGIHRALLAGLLSQIGLRDDARTSSGRGGAGTAREAERKGRQQPEYLGARNARFVVFPGSALAKKPPAALMSAELVETSRLFARMNAAIDPAWAEQLAGPLAKRTFSEPRWERRQGSAVADEKVTLFGVPIVPKRRIQLARVDAPLARELFIRHALVEEDWDTSRLDRRLFAFVRANRALRRELGEVEERTRRRDILAGDEAVVAFYEARVPADVTDTRAFERWWRGEHRRDPELLTMTRADLLGARADEDRDDGFPDRWRQADQTYSLGYRFEPGADDDGVTVVVPLVLLPRIRPDGFDWQVPGLRDELITALLRTLPKVLRRQVVPAAEWAAKIAAELPAGPERGAEREPFTAMIAQAIRRLTFAPVDPSDFDLDRVPPHLRVTFRAVDERGRTVGASKDLDELQARLADRTRDAVARAVTGRSRVEESAQRASRNPTAVQAGSETPPPAPQPASAVIAERSGITTWEWDELPAHVDTRQSGNVIRAYPALVDEKSSVALRLVATADERDRETRRGIRRLLVLATPTPVAYVQEHLSNEEKLALASSAYSGPRSLLDDCLAACVDAELRARHPDGLVRTRAEFEAVRDAIGASIVDRMFETVALVGRILRAARAADRAIAGASSMHLMAALGDMRTQLDALVPAGFVSSTGLARLRHLPRYLEAIVVRVRKLQENAGRDRQAMNQLEPSIAAFEAAGGRIPIDPEAPARLVRVRWMLEELRVGLFAQELRTAETVSPQRIAKALAD